MKQGNLVTFYKFGISENNQEIVSKSGLMASRPGFRRRAEAGPVEGLKFSTSGGMLGGAARIPTLCQGLSPQKGHSEDQHTFISLRRDSFLTVATFKTPGLYNLLWQAYSSQTRSFFDEDEFFSETGLSPIGPAFFALLVDEAVRGVKSELNVWYSDDATLGNYPERVHDDLVVLLERLRAIGLEVNGSKCELCNKALRSVFSQAVGRCLRGSGEASSTQSLTLFLREFYLVNQCSIIFWTTLSKRARTTMESSMKCRT